MGLNKIPNTVIHKWRSFGNSPPPAIWTRGKSNWSYGKRATPSWLDSRILCLWTQIVSVVLACPSWQSERVVRLPSQNVRFNQVPRKERVMRRHKIFNRQTIRTIENASQYSVRRRWAREWCASGCACSGAAGHQWSGTSWSRKSTKEFAKTRIHPSPSSLKNLHTFSGRYCTR